MVVVVLVAEEEVGAVVGKEEGFSIVASSFLLLEQFVHKKIKEIKNKK